MFLWNNLHQNRISRENVQLKNFSTKWNEILGSIYIITLNNVRLWDFLGPGCNMYQAGYNWLTWKLRYMTLKKLSLEIQINVMQLIFEAINDKSSIVKSVTTAKEDKFLLVVKDR